MQNFQGFETAKDCHEEDFLLPVTERNLHAQNSTRSRNEDHAFSEVCVRQEATQVFEQAYFHWMHVADDASGRTDARQNDLHTRVEADLAAITRQYSLGKPSSATPMERFSTLALPNETHPLLAKHTMAAATVDIGSLETVNLRAAVAKTLVEEMAPDEEDDFQDRMPSRHPRKAWDVVEASQKPRKACPPRMRKRPRDISSARACEPYKRLRMPNLEQDT